VGFNPEKVHENLNSDSSDELMIAQEQGVILKKGLLKSLQGTLIFTTSRLIFSCGNENVEQVSDESDNFVVDIQGESGVLVYSDVESLTSIPPSPSNLFIPISSIKSTTGHRGIGVMPRLKVTWIEDSNEKQAEFEQTLTGEKTKRNLNDWAELIQKLKSGNLKLKKLPPPPSKDSLEGKVAYVMGDMQEKGVLEIEQEVEQEFKMDLDPDQIEKVCDGLVSIGFLVQVGDPTGDKFYRKASPID
jgi:hypothetical protein